MELRGLLEKNVDREKRYRMEIVIFFRIRPKKLNFKFHNFLDLNSKINSKMNNECMEKLPGLIL